MLAYLILIALGGIASYPEYQWVFWLTLALSGVGLALAGSRRFARVIARVLKNTPYLWRLSERVEVSFESTRTLLAPREILLPTLISVNAELELCSSPLHATACKATPAWPPWSGSFHEFRQWLY